MHSVRGSTLALALAGLLVAGTGCATARSPRSSTPRPADTDPKLAQSTFIEEGNLVALVVATRATRYRLDRPFIPIEVAVANKGLEKLTLTRESFTLVGADGRRLPMASRDDITRHYGGSPDVDRRQFLEAAPIVNNRFSEYALIPSNFTPGFDDPIALERVQMPRFSYILDFLYFPRPQGGLDGPLELVLTAPELPDPVFVRFEIVGSGA